MSHKLLTFVIPCYNSEAYMEHCVDSLLIGGERVEIIIVNDGSKDHTGEIADRYAMRYPHIVRVVHQPNGGHGEAVNAGIRNATGKFFKVVDSDDWVDAGAYLGILDVLEIYQDEIDMMISNFVYEKQGAKHKKVMEYTKYLPVDKVFTWEDIKTFPVGKYLLMHSVIYRTKLLRDCGMVLPKHTFYVDNIFVFQPLPNVQKMYYLNLDFYRYFIGRKDQSVNEKVMISRLDQQMRVNRMMAEMYADMKISNKHLERYLFNYLSIVTTISSILAIKSGTDTHLAMKKELWDTLKKIDYKTWIRLRFTVLGISMHLPGQTGRKLAVGGYRLAQKLYGFN